MTQNAWSITQTHFNPTENQLYETLFALGNGTLGLRGCHEEAVADGIATTRGTYLNGFYESKPIVYGEKFYAYPETGQSMISVIDGLSLRPSVNGEAFQLGTSVISDYQRELNLQEGVLTRRVIWELADGQKIQLRTERFIAQERPSVLAIRLTLSALNFSGKVDLEHTLSNLPATRQTGGVHDPRLGHGWAKHPLQTDRCTGDEGRLSLSATTLSSGLSVSAESALKINGQLAGAAQAAKNEAALAASVTLEMGDSAEIDLIISYTSTLDQPKATLDAHNAAQLTAACDLGYQALKNEQLAYMQRFWDNAALSIDGDARVQLGLRFNMFHLLQSTGRTPHTNIAAKGLTGEGYEGHTFWDTEIYILPFFLYTQPEIARSLLQYRFRGLDAARARAREMGHERGALFPWRTINGNEVSPYFPGGTAQYHINADIAYAVQLYWDATYDEAFMREAGLPLLIETARLWLEVGHFDAAGAFHIDCVTGPDEYTALVDDNAYTNLMAAENLRFSAEMATQFSTAQPDLQPTSAETATWQRASAAVKIHSDGERGVIAQDATFLSKKRFDLANTPPEKHPLLLHYHPLVLYRQQVCKQADLLLAHYLLPEKYDREQKARDFAYYEPVTTHDSSLSQCIFGILACELGDHTKGYDYFGDSATTDLENAHGNTKDGIHAANMAGSWLSVVAGFGGMRTREQGTLSFWPSLPSKWTGYQFRMQFRGRRLEVSVSSEHVKLSTLSGDPIELYVYDVPVLISAEPTHIPLQTRPNLLGAR